MRAMRVVRVTQVAVTKRILILPTTSDRVRSKNTLMDLMIVSVMYCFQQVTKTNQNWLRYVHVAGKAVQGPFLSEVVAHY